jgi:hypothetical protein
MSKEVCLLRVVFEKFDGDKLILLNTVGFNDIFSLIAIGKWKELIEMPL